MFLYYSVRFLPSFFSSFFMFWRKNLLSSLDWSWTPDSTISWVLDCSYTSPGHLLLRLLSSGYMLGTVSTAINTVKRERQFCSSQQKRKHQPNIQCAVTNWNMCNGHTKKHGATIGYDKHMTPDALGCIRQDPSWIKRNKGQEELRESSIRM